MYSDMRSFIYSLMTDKTKGAPFLPLKFILYILSLLYGIGLSLRSFLYGVRLFRTHKAPLKVISVGNLTLGGTGKTPFVAMLGRFLKEEINRNVCVLIRGYGWDEQAMLKKNMPDIPVLVGENRSRSAHKAVKLYGCDTAVLDDGFQHWEISRDIDMVLLDTRNPFGNGYLFPRGTLRETKNALKRADIVIFTKVSRKNFDIKHLKEDLLNVNSNLVFLEAAHRPSHLYDSKTRKIYQPSHIEGKKVILLSGIGDPEYFNVTVADLGADVVSHIIYPDHHEYTEGDLETIVRQCNERNFDCLVTTEKDAVKLGRLGLSIGSYTVFVLTVEMEILSGKEELIAGLHSLYNS